MKRRICLIGIIALGLTAAAVRETPAYRQLATSAANFERYLDSPSTEGNSLSPIERLVFSLVLSNSKPHSGNQGTASARRT
jgi:hypothetical protein